MQRHILIVLLCGGGLFQLSALIPLFFPFAWMDYLHQAMGLEPLINRPLLQYLTRSECLLYAMWGALFLVLAYDVDRHLSLIRTLAILKVVFAIGLICVDVYAGMPWFWTAGEGPPQIIFATAVGWLAHQQLAKSISAET